MVRDDSKFSIEELLASIPHGKPATCEHRCQCECHIKLADGRPVTVHAFPCCGGCGKGHAQVLAFFLPQHLKECHKEGA